MAARLEGNGGAARRGFLALKEIFAYLLLKYCRAIAYSGRSKPALAGESRLTNANRSFWSGHQEDKSIDVIGDIAVANGEGLYCFTADSFDRG